MAQLQKKNNYKKNIVLVRFEKTLTPKKKINQIKPNRDDENQTTIEITSVIKQQEEIKNEFTCVYLHVYPRRQRRKRSPDSSCSVPQTSSKPLKVKCTGTCLSQQAKFTCQIARKPHC